MKFRGKISDPESIRLFAHLLGTLQKCSKRFVIRVMEDKLAIVVIEKHSLTANQQTGTGGTSAWCEIPSEQYFSEFNMEGVSPDANEIYLEICADYLATSLSSLKSANNINMLKMKLTKKVVPCFSLEIESKSKNSTVTCTHDIPVTLVGRKGWGEYARPEPPTFDVSLGMPETKILRLAMDRLKSIVCQKLTVEMTKKGKLVLSTSKYNVNCKVTFPDRHVYIAERIDARLTPPPEDADPDGEYSIDVDIKSIYNLIPPDGAKPTSIICSMTDGRLLHWLISFGEILLEYYVPGCGGSV